MTRSFRSHNVLGWTAAVGWLVSFGGNDRVCDTPRSLPMKRTANTIRAIDNVNIRMRLLTFVRFADCFDFATEPSDKEAVSEPRADRGPHAGSPRGVVEATGRFPRSDLKLAFDIVGMADRQLKH